MADGDTARLYHRVTSYVGEGWDWDVKADDPLVLQQFVANDFATWPAAAPLRAVRGGARRRQLVRPGPPRAGADQAATRRRRRDDADPHRRPVAASIVYLTR